FTFLIALLLLPLPAFTLFPYTTLFRSLAWVCEYPLAASALCFRTARPPKFRCPGRSRRPCTPLSRRHSRMSSQFRNPPPRMAHHTSQKRQPHSRCGLPPLPRDFHTAQAFQS